MAVITHAFSFRSAPCVSLKKPNLMVVVIGGGEVILGNNIGSTTGNGTSRKQEIVNAPASGRTILDPTWCGTTL